MNSKIYWLEKWKALMCKIHNSEKCLCNALDCSDCLFNADYNEINCNEAIDYIR